MLKKPPSLFDGLVRRTLKTVCCEKLGTTHASTHTKLHCRKVTLLRGQKCNNPLLSDSMSAVERGLNQRHRSGRALRRGLLDDPGNGGLGQTHFGGNLAPRLPAARSFATLARPALDESDAPLQFGHPVIRQYRCDVDGGTESDTCQPSYYWCLIPPTAAQRPSGRVVGTQRNLAGLRSRHGGRDNEETTAGLIVRLRIGFAPLHAMFMGRAGLRWDEDSPKRNGHSGAPHRGVLDHSLNSNCGSVAENACFLTPTFRGLFGFF